LRQEEKQKLAISVVDEGIQIDRSNAQSQNAESPSAETVLSRANLTHKRESQQLKHPVAMVLMPFQIVTSVSPAKYRTTQLSLKSSRKSPETAKKRFRESTESPTKGGWQTNRPKSPTLGKCQVADR
jgi:hypothetical protein